MSDAQTIPHVQVTLSLQEEGEALVIMMFNRLPGRTEIHVDVRGMNREQLAATLRVVAKSVEDGVPYA